jgi:preprotein translocase subunit SecG
MYTFLISLALFSAFMLVLVILAQNSKGGGLTSQFGGSGASNIMGVKKTGDLLERLTWGFVISIMIIALGTNMVSPTGSAQSDDVLDRVRPQQTAPAIEQTPATTDSTGK